MTGSTDILADFRNAFFGQYCVFILIDLWPGDSTCRKGENMAHLC